MEDSKFKSKELDDLFSAILSLQNMRECYLFFEDLCSASELTAIAQRFKVARMLAATNTHQTIARETGASTATISRINRCLQYGTGGYGLIIKRVRKEEE